MQVYDMIVYAPGNAVFASIEACPCSGGFICRWWSVRQKEEQICEGRPSPSRPCLSSLA